MGIWKALGMIWGADMISGGRLLDGRKGGIGYAWFYLFVIIFFPIWIIYKIIKLIFFRNR